MKRSWGGLNLLQAVVYGALAAYLWPRWAPAGAVAGVACAAQVAGGVGLLARDRTDVLRWCNVVSLAAVAFVVGLYAQVALHATLAFGSDNTDLGQQILGGVAVGLPWALAIPVAQLVALRPPKVPGAAGVAGLVALIAAVPPLAAVYGNHASTAYPDVDGARAAAWLYDPDGPAPSGAGPVALVATVVRKGEIVSSTSAEGPDLASALGKARVDVPEDGAVYLDVATAEGPIASPAMVHGLILRPGWDGFRTPGGLIGTLQVWRSGSRSRELAYQVYAPTVMLGGVKAGDATAWVRYDTWLASSDGVFPVKQTWTAAPPLDADVALAAAVAGGKMLAANLRPDGRFTYLVKGPSGEAGGGYNWPRHAGTCWFLARVAARTGDPELIDAARRALAMMAQMTKLTRDGRAWVNDDKRGDGNAWLGTSALGLLAYTALGENPDRQRQLALFLADSVAADGQTRGLMRVKDDVWIEQHDSSYAMGQGLLGLIAADRAGLPVGDAPARSMDYADGPYWPGPGGRLATADEHWMCLADLAAWRKYQRTAGDAVCRSYLMQQTSVQPVDADSPVRPAAGPAAGAAEAVVAAAWLDRDRGVESPWASIAADYGRLLVDNVYRDADRPLLGNAPRLIGGLRDTPFSYDVRIDAVQHAGCALLGIEALLRNEVHPGSLP